MATNGTVSIEQLKASLSTSALVITPDSEKYEDSIKRWAASAEKPAGIVVFPTSAEDVSKAVVFSAENGLELAVCGGGHATSGSSSTDGGLCIDLSKMRDTSVDVKKKTVTAQGGALWADVDLAAAKYGLAAVGGTVNHTGIGGLTLVGDGRIVTASNSENKDLFWAARGAGANFGVATSFTYQAHDQKDPVWGGILIFPKTALEQVVKFANHTLEIHSGKHTLLVGFVAPPPANMPVVLAVLTYIGSEDDAKAFYEPLLSLNPLADMTSAMSYPEINAIMNDSMFPGLRRTMKGSAFMPPLALTDAESIFSDFEEFLQKTPDAGATIVLLEFVSYHKILEVPQTATAFANRGAYGNLMFGPGWTSKDTDHECREWTRVMAAKTRAVLMQQIAAGTDNVTKDGVGEYVNYDSLGVSAEVLFGVNFPRLSVLKKQYDPKNVFCKGPNLLA